MSLAALGFEPRFREAFEALARPELVPARVVRMDGREVRVLGAAGELSAHVPRVLAGDPLARPVTGDWVAIDASRTPAVVRSVLPRATKFVRQAAGKRTTPQIVAANIDLAFVMTGLDGDFNPRRLERYIALVEESGARPVVLLTKAGMVVDVASYVRQAEAAAPSAPVHAIDVISGIETEAPSRYLSEGVTIALLGSSGVGKSTLANFLLGEDRLRTAAVRQGDDRGRHTTTFRELFVLPQGGAVIDTPGMRELQLWSDASGLEAAFPDVEALAAACRFSDCSHGTEPGCAVRGAVERGEIDAERVASFARLRLELDAHAKRRDEQEKKVRSRAHTREVRRGR